MRPPGHKAVTRTPSPLGPSIPVARQILEDSCVALSSEASQLRGEMPALVALTVQP